VMVILSVLRRVTLATPYGNPGCLPLSNPTKCRKLGLQTRASAQRCDRSCMKLQGIGEDSQLRCVGSFGAVRRELHALYRCEARNRHAKANSHQYWGASLLGTMKSSKASLLRCDNTTVSQVHWGIFPNTKHNKDQNSAVAFLRV
jgi:hypothetical protein